jgi:hypothetical protein
MNLTHFLERISPLSALALASVLLTPNAHANVYATNLSLNNGTTNVLVSPGESVAISYILNEPATLGVTVNIISGGTVVRSLSLSPNSPGTQTGANSVVWDGTDNNTNKVAPGTYSVSVTAAAVGYSSWTQITADGDATYVWEGRGIAIDRNTNSLYYGRIFVANAYAGPGNLPGDAVGILKLNADGSAAAEGASSAGEDGHTWTDDHISPWKLVVSADDYVYVDDLANGGEVFRWDPTLSSNAMTQVLGKDNQPSGANLSGLAIVGAGTNSQIWMADDLGNNGILQWGLTNNGACGTNDAGEMVVGLGTNFTLRPHAVTLDQNQNIYSCQPVVTMGDPSQRVFRFPAYDPSTNAGQPEFVADWAVGANDDSYGGASGIALDPSGNYVAVSFEGVNSGGLASLGNTKILYATNGALVANLDLGVVTDPPSTDTEHQDTDCVWDAVGNVYCIDNWFGYWRAYSPPGANQSTTLAVMNVQVGSPTPPTITRISVENGTVTILFTAGASDAPASFSLLSAANAPGPYSPAAGTTITQLNPGQFSATVPANGPIRFYRIQR